MGLRTLMLDRKPRERVGSKVCGDEISKSHFEATGIDYPGGEEISTVIAGADVYPPSLSNELRVRGWKDFDGWTVDRWKFGQRLLQEAILAGVYFYPDCHVKEPILRSEQVVGIAYQDLKTREDHRVYSKLVIDASGFAAVLRNKIDHPYVEKEIDKEDVALCYREILKLSEPLREPEVARVFLGGDIAPGGYAWMFPKGVEEVNVGVGVCGGKGRGSPKSHFLEFKKEYPLFEGSEVLESSGGAVPVRRPMMSLVGDGVAFVGDAALQTNPIHGGGIGAGMRAGTILGEVAKEAIAGRNPTAKGLWTYNTRYLSDFGSRLASLEIFRRLLQQVSDEEMDFGFEKRLLEADDLMNANRGEGFSMGPLEKLKRFQRGIKNIRLLMKIQKAASLMKKIANLYENYPLRPNGLEKWNEQVLGVIEQADFS